MSQKISMKLPNDQDSSGRSFGPEELTLLKEVMESGTLIGTSGKQVKKFEEEFAKAFGMNYCCVVGSGTDACHTAYAALNLEPCDELICSPITDIGSITPLLYQLLIPVFADVDPLTLNITASSIAKKITPRTKGIIVTHLFGNPCEMEEIIELAHKHQLTLIEDCAQSYLATINGKLTGTFGKISCFSQQQGKHMTCGEGGTTLTNDPDLGRRMRLFRDKGWGFSDPAPDHYFLGLNYRMTELQAAVARAQLQKLTANVKKRVDLANHMHELLKDIPGLKLPIPKEGVVHTYWKYLLMVDETIIKGGADSLGAQLKEKGIWCVPRYIKKPAFECEVIRSRKTFGKSGYPYTLAGRKDNFENPKDYPGVYKGLSQALVLPLNENYTIEQLNYIADNIKDSLLCLQHK